jgi:hypothetical protein
MEGISTAIRLEGPHPETTEAIVLAMRIAAMCKDQEAGRYR